MLLNMEITCRALIPCLVYHDAPAAIDFLCRAFGFEKQVVYADPADPQIIHHAQLLLGQAMLMLNSAKDDPTQDSLRLRTPKQAGGVTACLAATLAESELDAHYQRAKAAGAEIVRELHANQGYPGRSYNARDPEGYDWDFGTYDPWAPHTS